MSYITKNNSIKYHKERIFKINIYLINGVNWSKKYTFSIKSQKVICIIEWDNALSECYGININEKGIIQITVFRLCYMIYLVHVLMIIY